MKLPHHTVLSVVSAGAVYLFSNSLPAALACFLSGIFIDLDHLFEYFYYFGPGKFSVKQFFWAANNHVYRRFFLFLHSYELAILFWIVSLAIIRRPWAWGFSLGFTLHLICDHIYNPCAPLTYTLLFRARHRFHGDRLFPPELQKKYHKKKRHWGRR